MVQTHKQAIQPYSSSDRASKQSKVDAARRTTSEFSGAIQCTNEWCATGRIHKAWYISCEADGVDWRNSFPPIFLTTRQLGPVVPNFVRHTSKLARLNMLNKL